jgi:DNA topoisomerase-6 subunit B
MAANFGPIAVPNAAWRTVRVLGPAPIRYTGRGEARCPFTSESKEAIADYDEMRKEIKLAPAGMRTPARRVLRRRERTKSEFRRRNIFELCIEEVVEACARLKGGKLAKEKLKGQLQKIAIERTGGVSHHEGHSLAGAGPFTF